MIYIIPIIIIEGWQQSNILAQSPTIMPLKQWLLFVGGLSAILSNVFAFASANTYVFLGLEISLSEKAVTAAATEHKQCCFGLERGRKTTCVGEAPLWDRLKKRKKEWKKERTTALLLTEWVSAKRSTTERENELLVWQRFVDAPTPPSPQQHQSPQSCVSLRLSHVSFTAQQQQKEREKCRS